MLKQHYRPSGHWNESAGWATSWPLSQEVKTTLPPFGALKLMKHKRNMLSLTLDVKTTLPPFGALKRKYPQTKVRNILTCIVKTTLPPFGALKPNWQVFCKIFSLWLKQHYRPSGHWNLFFEKNSLLLHPNGVKTTLPPFGALKLSGIGDDVDWCIC